MQLFMACMMQRPKMKNFEKWNEELFRKYASEDRYIHPNFLIRAAANMRADSIVKALKVNESTNALDVGCGSGFIMRRIRKGTVTGVDLSDTALAMARKNLARQANVRFVKGNAEKLPFENNYFDRVVCADVLEHVPNPEKAVSEIARVAKKGATIVIALPNEELQHNLIRTLTRIGLKRFIKGTDTHREWHIHESGLGFFSRIHNGLAVKKVISSPMFAFPLTYIFVCRK